MVLDAYIYICINTVIDHKYPDGKIPASRQTKKKSLQLNKLTALILKKKQKQSWGKFHLKWL